MKLLALMLLISGCEHDPRYEHHGREEGRGEPAATQLPADAGSDKTVERHGVDIPPITQSPKITPQRTHRRHH